MVIYNRSDRTVVDAASENLLDEDECDGWGPVRPRRSSAPVPIIAASDADEHDEDPLQTAPKDSAR